MSASGVLPVAAEFVRRWIFRAVGTLRIGDQTFHILLASAIGTLAALSTAAFLHLIRIVEGLFFGTLFPAMGSRPYLIFLLPAMGGLLIAPLLHFFPSQTEGVGIPYAMESVKNVAQLPVVSDPHSRKLIGVLRREEILEAYQKKIVAGGRYGAT